MNSADPLYDALDISRTRFWILVTGIAALACGASAVLELQDMIQACDWAANDQPLQVQDRMIPAAEYREQLVSSTQVTIATFGSLGAIMIVLTYLAGTQPLRSAIWSVIAILVAIAISVEFTPIMLPAQTFGIAFFNIGLYICIRSLLLSRRKSLAPATRLLLEDGE